MENIDFNFNKENSNASGANGKKLSVFTPSTTMSVSGILHRGDEKAMCVFIQDIDKSIEIRITLGKGCEVLANNGYSEDEASDIISYLDENASDIAKTAKEVNPMKAFMS